jgi:HSP20 family protein
LDDRDKKRRRRNPFWDIFENFEQFQEIIEEMMRQLFQNPEKIFRDPEELLRNPPPMFYGFSVTIGPDGKPQIKPIGKGDHPFKPTIELEQQQQEEEPLVDVFNEEKEIIVVAEIPGVRKDDIKVDATKNTIYIWVNANMKKFNKEIQMPCKINPKTVESSYKNRVLEIRAQKA